MKKQELRMKGNTKKGLKNSKSVKMQIFVCTFFSFPTLNGWKNLNCVFARFSIWKLRSFLPESFNTFDVKSSKSLSIGSIYFANSNITMIIIPPMQSFVKKSRVERRLTSNNSTSKAFPKRKKKKQNKNHW